ncbi:MAG TPA: hypothetical protein VMU32_07550 [Solirubrobacteraceae bacterium]|nr:hypothetical protein [Solirubrobacteraceae bacterium]
MEIRSYRGVFALERRIYRVDRLRLNPSGVPVRGVLYWLALTLAVLLLGRLPLLGAAADVLPWYLRALALPAGAAAVLAMIRIEGRPFHLAAVALARFAGERRQLSGMSPCPGPGGRWHPPRLAVLPDGSEGRPRRVRYAGPGTVRIAVAHDCELRRTAIGRRELVVRPRAGSRTRARGQVVVLGRGGRLRVG